MKKKVAKLCDNNNEVFKMLNRTVDELKALGFDTESGSKDFGLYGAFKRASHRVKRCI